MPVKYNDKFIIPAPFVSINTEKDRIGDGRQLGDRYSISVNGTFLSYFSGIYDNESDNQKEDYVSEQALSLLLDKQRELIDLFATEGKALEIIGLDTSTSSVFYPTINSIDFGEGNWNQLCEYSISLQANDMVSSGEQTPDQSIYTLADGYKVNSANDTYQMDNNDDGSATITRLIESNGALVYDPNNPGQLLNGIYPWQQASGWCITRDYDDIEAWYSGIIDTILPGWKVIDQQVNIDVGRMDGNYSIERGWIISNTGVYILGKDSDESEDIDTDINTLGLNVNVQGLGFTSPKRYSHAKTYWSDAGSTTTAQKTAQVRAEFSDIGADTGGWYFRSFGESQDREAGTVSAQIDLTGHSGVFHSYTVDGNTEWIGLPEKTLALNGTITGVGETVQEKLDSAIDYYTNDIDFEQLLEVIIDAEWVSTPSGAVYLQTQSLAINNDTGEVNYSRNYTHHEANFKDIWTVDLSQEVNGGANDTINIAGTLQGLASDKTERWTNVFNAFNTNFANDDQVWNSKVTTVLGASTPPSGFVTTRTFNHDYVNGTIGYNYAYSTSPASGTVDYAVDAAYDRSTNLWTVSVNGTARGDGLTSDERIANAMLVVPGEFTAWNHAYNTLVSRLDDNAQPQDDPIITQLPNEAYMTTRSFNAEEREGVVTFTYSWQSASGAYTNTFNTDYSWDEITATETVSVNGTLKAIDGNELPYAWETVWKNGDPDCPNSVFASRHQTYFSDKANITEEFPNSSPITGTPRPTPTTSFDRSATLQTATYAINDQTNEVTYNFSFTYRAWPYGLPLWFTNVDITFDKVKPVDLWVRKQIIGKRSGPVHQNMTSRTANTFNVSINLAISKRKGDQFGAYSSILLEEYSEYILRKVFLERSGYSTFNYSHDDPNQNCYLTSDTFNLNTIGTTLSRSTAITMLNILD